MQKMFSTFMMLDLFKVCYAQNNLWNYQF